MPLCISEKITENFFWGLWHIQEPARFFEENTTACLPEFSEKRPAHSTKYLQGLAAHFLLATFCKKQDVPFWGIYKDKHGKPFLLKQKKWEISISHSENYAAVAFRKCFPVGIDCEKIGPKPARIASRFMSAPELNRCDKSDRDFTFYWAAKEAVYKCYGKKGISFSKQIVVLSPHKAQLFLKDATIDMNISAHLFNNLWVVLAYRSC